MNRRFPPAAYTVAWISALPIEAAAAAEMLDEAHHDPRNHGSMDQYVFGRIGHHNVVMACLPSGQMGTNSAAAVAGHLLGTFPCISFAFMVGIGGGVPSADVRLGDVVVGHPHLQHSGVVQYDFGKTGPEGQMRIGSLDAPPRALLNAIATLRSNGYRSLGNLARHLSVFDRLSQFCRNTAGEDILYDASYRHEGGESCGGCSNGHIVKRHQRPGKDIMIHYGTIASGNQVIKDGVTRDKLSAELGGVLCFEMEAAGLVNVFKSIVIRGICDYADSHKNKRWQPYAAGTAAAVAKELLLLVPAVEMKTTPEITGASSNPIISTSQHQIDPATGTEDYRIRFSLKGVPLGRFADRPEDIKQLENTLLPEPDNCRRKILVLQGLGGIGKTQLAVEFARKHQTTFTSVFWLDGSSEDSLKQSFVQCLARIPILDTERSAESSGINGGAGAVRKAMEWLSLTGNKSWLLIFDNVDRDYEQPESDPYAYDLENYLPDVDHGSILITTRLAKLEQLGESMHLQTVDTAQAQAIFRKWYNRDFDPSDSGELLQLLDGLPLALAQAGAYMNETGTSFSEYIKIYKEQWNDLMGAKATAALKSYRNRSINTTWMVSLHAIQSINRAAANLLLLWAHLDHKALPYWILERSSSKGLKEILTEWMGDAAYNEIKFQEIVRLLRNYGLVESAQEGSGHSTHPVVHQWAFHMQDEDQKSRLSRLALLIIGYAVPNELTNELNNEFARSLDRLQKQLFAHAESWLEKWGGKLQEIIQHTDENETKGLATALKEIGLLAEGLDDPRKAETMYRLALHAQERVCGPDGLETLYIICVLAMLCTNRGNTKEGETLCLRALEGYEKTYGSDYIYNKNALETLEILGVIYYAQGLPKKAETMFQRALEGRNKAYSPDHYLTLQAVLNLGIVYSYENRHQEAESLFLQVLEGYEKAWGPEYIFTPAVLSAMNNLGMGYNNQQKFEKAEEILKQALEGSEKAFGPYRTPTLATMTSLGLVYTNLGKLDEAEQMLDRALVGYERLWGPDYMLTHHALDVVDYLSRVYFRQGRLDESEKMYQRSIEVKSRTWGADHPSTLGSMSGLASVYLSVGRLEEAEKLYRRAVKGYEMTFGTDDDPVWTDYQSLDLAHKYGWLLSHQGRLESARAMTMKALKGYETLYGKGNQYFIIVQELLDQITSAMSASEGTSATKSLPLLFLPPPPPEVLEVDSGFKALSMVDVESRRLEGGEENRSSDDYVDHEKWKEEEDWEVVGT